MTAILLALALVLAVGISSCVGPAPSQQPEVKVGLCLAFTGPLASTAVADSIGKIDYLKLTNEKGGISGIPISYSWRDATTVPGTLAAHKRLKIQGIMLEMHTGAGFCEAVAPFAQKDETPLLYSGGYTQGMVTQPIKWAFAGTPGFTGEAIAGLEWIIENWKEARPLKLGVLMWDYGPTWDTLKAIEDYAAKQGLQFVGHEVVPMLGAIDTTVEWIRLADKDPDWVYVETCAATLVAVAKDADRLEIQGKPTKIMSCTYGIDTVLDPAGDSAEEWYSVRELPFTSADAHLPGMKEIHHAAQEYRNLAPDQISNMYTRGWLCSMVAVEALRVALEEVGLENLTGSAVREAMVNVRDYDTGLIPPITINEQKPYYNGYLRIAQVQDGKMKPLPEWTEIPIIGITF